MPPKRKRDEEEKKQPSEGYRKVVAYKAKGLTKEVAHELAQYLGVAGRERGLLKAQKQELENNLKDARARLRNAKTIASQTRAQREVRMIEYALKKKEGQISKEVNPYGGPPGRFFWDDDPNAPGAGGGGGGGQGGGAGMGGGGGIMVG